MTHPAVVAARDFIREAELPYPPPIDLDVAKAPSFVYDADQEQATVVGSEVIAFVKGVTREQRQDVVNAVLLAQLVARTKVAQPRALSEVEAWYNDYFDVLSQLGFVLQHRDFAEYKETSQSFEAHEAILEVASALLAGSPSAVLLVRTTLQTLQRMTADSPWMTLFNRESQSANTARFQLSLLEQDENAQLILSIMAFGLQAEHTLSQVLFLKFRSNEVRLHHHSGKVAVNAPLLAAVREQIAGKLVAYTTEYIQGLKLP